MRRYILIVVVLLINISLFGCSNNLTAEQYIKRNDSTYDDRVTFKTTTQSPVLLNIYEISLSEDEWYIYEYDPPESDTSLIFECIHDDGYDRLSFISSAAESKSIGYLPKYECDTENILVIYSPQIIDAVYELGYFKEIK